MEVGKLPWENGNTVGIPWEFTWESCPWTEGSVPSPVHMCPWEFPWTGPMGLAEV